MSAHNQLASPFEGKPATNFQRELIESRFFEISDGEALAEQIFPYAHPKAYARYQADFVSTLQPQPEQIDYSQPLDVVPSNAQAVENIPTQPQPTDILDISAIRATIDQIPVEQPFSDDISGLGNAA